MCKKSYLVILLVLLCSVIKAEPVLDICIHKVDKSLYPKVKVYGVVFNVGSKCPIKAEDFTINEGRKKGTNITCEILGGGIDYQAFCIVYESLWEELKDREVFIGIETNAVTNPTQSFLFKTKDVEVASGAKNAYLRYRTDNIFEKLESPKNNYINNSNVLEPKNVVLNYNQLLYQNFRLLDSEQKRGSFLTYLGTDFFNGFQLKKDTIVIWSPNDIEEFDAEIARIQNYNDELRLLVQHPYSNDYLPWDLSYSADSMLLVRTMEQEKRIIHTYINSNRVIECNCLPNINQNVYWNEVDSYYYLIADSFMKNIRYISNYKGCPMRESADVQSKMIRYLLQKEPVLFKANINQYWIKVEDVFGNMGYLLKKDVISPDKNK